MSVLSFTLLGEPASKANRRRIVSVHGKVRSIKSPEALAYAQAATLQVPGWARQRLSNRCAIRLRIWYASERPDLDESVVLDVLQAAGVVVNDRQFREKHVFHGVDKRNPRCEVEIWEIGS